MKGKSFDKAYSELKKIVDDLQSDEVSIDKLSAQLKKAAELAQFCKEKLREVEEDIERIEN